MTTTGATDVHTLLPESRVLSLHVVALTVSYLRQRGVTVAEVLKGSGIHPELLQAPSQLITCAQELVVLDNARRLCQEPALGLTLGATIHATGYGLLGYCMMVSATLGQAVQCLQRFPMLLGSYFKVELRTQGRTASLLAYDYHYRADMEVLNAELCLVSLWTMLCDALGKPLKPTEVRLRHKRPAYAREYSRVLGCPAVFGAPTNALVFERDWLELVPALADPVSFFNATNQCVEMEREWLSACGNTLIARVLRRVKSDPQRYHTLAAVAQALLLSERTLRRRLQDCGTTFQTLLDEALHEKARDYLRRTNLPIAEIAHRLGYSETSSFRQAFRRWRGQNPSEYREADRLQSKAKQHAEA